VRSSHRPEHPSKSPVRAEIAPFSAAKHLSLKCGGHIDLWHVTKIANLQRCPVPRTIGNVNARHCQSLKTRNHGTESGTESLVFCAKSCKIWTCEQAESRSCVRPKVNCHKNLLLFDQVPTGQNRRLQVRILSGIFPCGATTYVDLYSVQVLVSCKDLRPELTAVCEVPVVVLDAARRHVPHIAIVPNHNQRTYGGVLHVCPTAAGKGSFRSDAVNATDDEREFPWRMP
jgi:hypothetical protein